MNTKDRLQIILPTYNRAPQLKRTLEQLLADDSPVKDFDITILDNRSTDGTSNVIKNAQSLHPNIKHIRHRHNVGGNANIAKALEMGEKKYLWVICDDDLYDWTGWSNVEELIDNGEKLMFLMSIKKLADILPADGFLRIHRSYIVNMNKAKEISKMRIKLSDDTLLPISDMYKNDVQKYIDERTIGK